ncbi:hypothetical protein [Selenihalanaerobacter shriftii]|uniref:hypothetical protein n=1 Tax=Selenihalanaerobacter shriftii TaxID=142842 RepID=UPI00135656FF|nr:hypothetical protein [Selenihalanaerobacter shriftii]
MQNILIAAIFIGIIIFEVPTLVKNEEWRELTVFSFLLLVGLVLVIMMVNGFSFSRFYI